jgi:hypothetical protein
LLDATNQNRATIHIPLPVDGFQNSAGRREGYVVLVQFFMRITDIVCEETNNPALWATVYGDSSIAFQTEARVNPNDLAALPYPFIAKNTLDGNRVTFSFSKNPSSVEVNAAANLAMYLGAQSTQELTNISARTDAALDATQPNIAIRSTSGLSALSLNESTLTLGGESPLLASEALLNPELFNQIQGTSVQVRRTADASLDKKLWTWRQNAATFAQLGAADRTVQGVGAQSLFLSFTRPAGWKLTADNIYLDLHITRSPLLLAESSEIKVKINGADMGAISYAEKPQANGFYRFMLPADILNVGLDEKYVNELTVELIFEHQLAQKGCEPIYSENAWTTIHANSYFYLAHDAVALPDISVFPYPFIDPNQIGSIEIVLPPAPNNDEIAAALTLAQLIGKHNFGATPKLQIVYADEIPEIRQNAILIGTAERNHWVKDADTTLPPARQDFAQTAITNDAIGHLKEIASPWAQGKWVLMISGASNLKAVVSALGTQLPSASLIAVRKDGSVEPLFRAVPAPQLSAPAQPKPPAPLLPQPKSWQVVLGVFVLTALVALIAVLIYRRRGAG